MKIKPSHEACQKAYQYILPTVIEICKKKQQERNQERNNGGNGTTKDDNRP